MELKLRYSKPAPDNAEGWEKYSMPIGNSYMGGNVFGGVEAERIQVTENSLENPRPFGGLNSFADIYFRFPHREDTVKNYERGLDIGRALAWVQYDADGNHVERTYFATYPDRAIVGRICSDKPMTFTAEMKIPHLTEEEGREKRGEVTAEGNIITMTGVMLGYEVYFAAQLAVISNGTITAENGILTIADATQTTFAFCCGTNYVLRSEVFLEQDNKKKLIPADPLPNVKKLLATALEKTWDELYDRHEADYGSLFNKVSLELGETNVPKSMTDELLEAYGKGELSRYLEVLYFQYGRYLLISASRPGALPANLQGVWNCYDRSPWGSGYWHNINVQMNYWPAFVTGIGETFDAYIDFYKAFRPQAEKFASEYISEIVPENASDIPGDCGWAIGTASYPYRISRPRGHSGPGTGGLTSKLFWEAYAFTGDKTVLREVAYPALLAMAKFLCKVVRNYDGLYLSVFSASPEQILSNTWGEEMQYYHTVGCAFDQQMIWENGRDLLECVSLIGEENLPEEDLVVIRTLREQIERYDPVQVGWSGQIKEFREEKFYGEVGEFRHRHISQLVGLYPGTSISHDTPAWLDAARVSLELRSDESTGWALAHRLNAWARIGDGNRSHKLFSNLLGKRTLPNLWDFHPPFQIDGNLGGTSGVAEMLLQSHESAIVPLPSLPDVWHCGSYKGLAARGGFSVDVSWENGCAHTITIHSAVGNPCTIRYPGLAQSKFDFPAKCCGDTITFETKVGGTYTFADIPFREKMPVPTFLRANRQCELTWEFAEPVDIWRATDSASEYELLAEGVTGGKWTDSAPVYDTAEIVTYKITRHGASSSDMGACTTLNHSTVIERERYRYWIRQLNIPRGGAEAPDYLGE